MYKITESYNTENRSGITGYTLPQAVSVTKNPDDETREQIINRQDRFLKLPEEVKNKLVSYETAKIIQQMGQAYNLELLQMAEIARAIRSYYFGEITLENFPSLLSSEMRIDFARAQEITRQVIEKIINNRSLGINKSLIEIPILQAIKQYPKIGEQPLTSNPIKLKYFPSTVRPSIKNWIEDYRQQLGAEKHGTMERGDYLYHSENARKLTPGERQKLSIILKSLDEGTPVAVDPDRGEVIFKQEPASLPQPAPVSPPVSVPTPPPAPRPAAPPSAPAPVRKVDSVPNKSASLVKPAVPLPNFNASPKPESKINDSWLDRMSERPNYFNPAAGQPPQSPPERPVPQNQTQSVEDREIALGRHLRTKNLGISYESYPLDIDKEFQKADDKPEPKINGNVVDLRKQQ